MSGQVRINRFRLTDAESRKKVKALLDSSIILWQQQAKEVRGTAGEIIAENYIDAFEAIRRQLLGPRSNGQD